MIVSEKAVIDLGTNTFHLLIFSRSGALAPIQPVFKRRIFVKLAEEGIDWIGPSAADRALAAMQQFADLLRERGIQDVKAIGTAAMRRAGNSEVVLQNIRAQTGIEVEVISGMQEAQFIADGVQSACSGQETKAMIMDIGGGSVEFILMNFTQLSWMVSLPIGVGILYNKFHCNDPIGPDEEKALRDFLAKELIDVKDKLLKHQVKHLIGASGTFDVIADLFSLPQSTYAEMKPSQITETLSDLTKMTIAERNKHPAIPDSRVDMIVVAVILIQEVLALNHFERLGISKYALKEGLALNI